MSEEANRSWILKKTVRIAKVAYMRRLARIVANGRTPSFGKVGEDALAVSCKNGYIIKMDMAKKVVAIMTDIFL